MKAFICDDCDKPFPNLPWREFRQNVEDNNLGSFVRKFGILIKLQKDGDVGIPDLCANCFKKQIRASLGEVIE